MPLDSAELVSWFGDRPRWIQEAAHLFLTKETLTSADLQRLSISCKAQAEKLDLTSDPAPLPVTAFVRKAAGKSLRLIAISEVKGIEGLNPRTPLTFSQDPITIIYGGTGAGKSSYVRILNNVCGSKNRRQIIGDVFKEDGFKTCKISYEFEGTIKDIIWQPTDGLQAELAALEIFDSECSHVYVNADNEVAFEPWLLGLFQRLVDTCGEVDCLLEGEMQALPSQRPAMPGELAATEAAGWYQGINAETTAEEITKWCDWLPTHQGELDGLYARLLEKNPAQQANQLRIRKTGLENLLSDLLHICEALNADVVEALLRAKLDVSNMRKAASEDAEKVFNNAPLDGVGLESWKLLWDRARTYSEQMAYIGKTFPFTEDDARCVLCQQPLDDDAKRRLLSFEQFVKGELESLAIRAEMHFGELVEKLPEIPSYEEFRIRLATLGIEGHDIAERLHQLRDDAEVTLTSLREATIPEQVQSAPTPEPIDGLSTIIGSLEARAKAFDQDSNKTDKGNIKKDVRELEARKWLHEQKGSVDAEIARSKKVAALQAARHLTDTTTLSKKKGELAHMLVSEAFIGRFEAELKALSAARIKVELVRTHTDKGHVFHRIRLKNPKIDVPTSDVLSEGELRAVSLAAFIADIEGIESNTPIVFDDPISSLDQDFEEAFATRLVRIAGKRQVIVFTHRLSMLTLLEEAAKAAGVATGVIALNREPWGAGEPSETPFSTRKPEKVINGLNDRLARARKVFNENGKEQYDLYAKGICSDVRILVERMVEDTLLNEVIRRFRRAVHTQNKIGSLAKINHGDCRLIDEFMTKYSRFEHSQPSELPVPLPEPEEIGEDLRKLKVWLDEFSKREVPQG